MQLRDMQIVYIDAGFASCDGNDSRRFAAAKQEYVAGAKVAGIDPPTGRPFFFFPGRHMLRRRALRQPAPLDHPERMVARGRDPVVRKFDGYQVASVLTGKGTLDLR